MIGSDGPDDDFIALQAAVAGEYSVERELGRGGMGAVFLAREVALDRLVAIKLLPPRLVAVPEVRERFVREARIAAQLSHPNIVPIHRVEVGKDLAYLVMGYVRGETLTGRLKRVGRMPPTDCARMLQGVSWALDEAHRHNVIHRDIKPDNIMLEQGSDRPIVLDFGIAREQASTTRTETGQVLGTVHFMSPEQWDGRGVDARSDIYSLGVVGYLAASGRLPFDGAAPMQVLAQQASGAPRRLQSLVPSLPLDLALAIERCLAPEPAQRHQSAKVLAEALDPAARRYRGVPPALRLWLTGQEAPFSTAFWTVALIAGLLWWVGASGNPAPAWLWAAAVAVPLVYRAWLRVASLRQLLREGYGIEDLRRGLADLDAEQHVATRLLRTPNRAAIERTALTFAGIGAGVPEAMLIGRTWSKARHGFWGSGLAERFVRLVGLGAGKVHSAPAYADRPTEAWVRDAAISVFHSLPKDLQARFAALPATLARLERQTSLVRARLGELDALLGDVWGSGATARDAVLEAHRDMVHGQLDRKRTALAAQVTAAIGLMEELRLGLLLLRAGSEGAIDLDDAIAQARELGERIDFLLAGQLEVAQAMAPPAPE